MKLIKLSLVTATAVTIAFAGGDIVPVEPVVSAAAVTNPLNVELYGQAHLSVDSIDNGTNTVTKVASSSSRLGVKASYALSNDVTILGQYEAGVDLTGTGKDDGNGGDYTNNAALFTSARDSFAGIKSNQFGMIIAGNLPAINQWMYDYNLFADQVGDLGNMWGHSSAIGIDRASDTIAYFIPGFIEGLSGDIAYVSDLSDANDGNSLTATLVKLNYANNGFKLGIGYVVANNKTVNPTLNPNDLAITASYSTDSFSIGGGYVTSDDDTGINPKRNSYSIGGSYTMNKATLKAQYTNINADVVDSNANMIAVGVDYALSKDATIYIAYADTSNDAKVHYQSNNWGHGKSAYGTPADGLNSKSFSAGLVYKFNTRIFDGS